MLPGCPSSREFQLPLSSAGLQDNSGFTALLKISMAPTGCSRRHRRRARSRRSDTSGIKRDADRLLLCAGCFLSAPRLRSRQRLRSSSSSGCLIGSGPLSRVNRAESRRTRARFYCRLSLSPPLSLSLSLSFRVTSSDFLLTNFRHYAAPARNVRYSMKPRFFGALFPRRTPREAARLFWAHPLAQ